MPRRPTRSKTNRPTRKEISRRLDDLGEEYGDLPNLTLVEVLSYETETVDEGLGVVRIVETDELRRRGEGGAPRCRGGEVSRAVSGAVSPPNTRTFHV